MGLRIARATVPGAPWLAFIEVEAAGSPTRGGYVIVRAYYHPDGAKYDEPGPWMEAGTRVRVRGVPWLAPVDVSTGPGRQLVVAVRIAGRERREVTLTPADGEVEFHADERQCGPRCRA
jgi:hypothetical protein